MRDGDYAGRRADGSATGAATRQAHAHRVERQSALVNALRRPSPAVRLPLGISLAVVLLLATIGSFAVGFGVMTGCTNTYSCTTVSCRPCAATSTWLSVGWAVQGVLLVVAVTLTVLGVRGIRLHAVRLGAWLLGSVSIALMAGTTWLAVRSY